MPWSRIRAGCLASSMFLAAAAVFAVAPSEAQNILPTQGVVTSGAASIHQSGADLSVTQTSPRAIVNWGSFSIGQGNGVAFAQPSASSAILNRVTGATTSTIAGQLQANGQVYLVNPNGIAITKTGAVRVGGGFVASTLGIADNDFNSGKLDFVGNGASAGVANAGSIQAAQGGFVGLIGGTVANSGVVSVPVGKVAMSSGEQATLNLTGDNFLQVAVPTGAKTADGQALIDVSGKVRAAGGSVQLKAATIAKAIRDAVNVPGELSVASARASGGSIILSGGVGGNVAVTGRLDASGRAKGGAITIGGHDVALKRAKLVASGAEGRGGSVTVTGTRAVGLASTSVDSSGATGGGAIRIGRDFHGAANVPSAQTTTIDSTSTLNASATASGDGGTVAVWSDAKTTFAGQIAATGGVSGGNGGYAEVSANPATRGVLSFTGSADLSAPKGTTGTLLLDPYDIVISTGTDSGGSFSGGAWTPTATSVINTSTLETQLAHSNVVVSTGLLGSPGTDAGNITVSAPITWSSINGLTLTAANGIAINAPISVAGAGQLTLNYSTTSPANLSFGAGGNVSYAVGSGKGIPGQALTINGNAYALLYSMGDIAGINGGSGNVALATSLTAPTTAFAAAVVPSFSGTFEGLGNTITGLKINDTSGPGPDGLFGALVEGTIRDVGLIGGSVAAGANAQVVGGLVGENDAGVVANSYARGTVSGSGSNAYVGGLVGYNNGGTVETSFASGAVSGPGSNAFVGGLVGNNGGAVQTSFASGAVSGLASNASVGGLVGDNFGTVQTSYSTGAVSGSSNVGGLVGLSSGSVSTSYWDTQTSGQATSAGGAGATGLSTAQLQGALPSGFASPWATGPGLYPYFTNFFPNGVRAVSGFAYKDAGATPLASGLNGAATVLADANGATLGNSTTGANGYYYILAHSGSIPSGANVVVYTQANAATGATNAATYFVSAGANDSSSKNIFGSTLTETTPNTRYSLLAAGLANAAGTDSGAHSAIAGVSNINISETGASFTVDQAITTPDNLKIQTTSSAAPLTISDSIAVSNAGSLTLATNGGGTLTINGALATSAGAITLTGPTVLDPTVTTGGGNITFNSPVTLSADTTVDSGAGATTFVSTVDGDHFLTVSGAVVNFGGKVGSVTPLAGLAVTGLANLFGNITTHNGPITFNNALLLNANLTLNSGTATTTFGGTVDSGDCACDLTASAGAFSFSGALGGTNSLGAVSLSSTNGMTLPSVSATSIRAQTTGASADLTLAPGTILTGLSTTDTAVTLAAGRGFINQSGAGAIRLNLDGGTARWLIYSANPADDVFNNLNSNNTAVWDTPFGGTVTAPGDRYVFAFQPTITVTSIDDSKTYGQDVTSRVATDFVISGLEPGFAGAYLGDAASAVFSGTPQVTSLGSPARAPVTDSPYPITVAQGSFTVSDGYALVLDSAGKLTVAPLPITFSVADAASTYGTTPTLGAATLFGVLAGDTVVPTVGAFSGTTPAALGPRTPAGAYSEEVTALDNPNYTIAPFGNTPGTLTIGPKTVSYSVANATSLFGTTPILGPATLFGVLPGDVVFPTVGVFFGFIPITLTPTTPTGQYAEVVTAISNPNYRIAPAPNFPGILIISTGNDPGFLPGLTQINNPAPASYGGGEVLPDFTSRCIEPPSMPDPNRFSDPDAALRAISQSMENYFKRCQNPTQTTIADALEAYAAKLQVLAPRLPPALRNIPSIVAEAARRARAAPSRAAAVAVLRQTVATIHKEIALVLSEDPATRSRELRDGDVVAGALSGAAVALVNSGGL